ncbi:MAG: CBS domain-containing protein, partial [Desulfobacterales bacterium]|nr:CBS domain-containing protein [Desulfobacterales bacterium]
TVLIRTNPFEMLENEALEALAAKVTVRTYAPGAYIFKQGEPSRDCLFIIAVGQVEITLSSGRGREESVAGFRKPYDFFGETVVLSGERYPGGARARDALVCCTVSRPDLEKIIYRTPEFSGFFNALLTERMRLIFKQLGAEQSTQSIGRSEPGLFRRRVSEVMTAPVIACRPEDSVASAARVMDEKKISALVVQNSAGYPVGILTEKKLVNTLIARQKFPVDTCTVARLADNRVTTIEPGATLGQAIALMVGAGVRQLPVIERGSLVGIVTSFDLIRTRSTGVLAMAREIDGQPDIASLARQGRAVDKILATLASEKAGIGEIIEIMSEMHTRLNQRVIQLAEDELKREGLGSPPCVTAG